MVTYIEEKALLSDRVRRLRGSLTTINQRLSCERLRFLMEAYEERKGDPDVVKRARVLEKVLGGMTIFIDENVIVGTQTRYRAGIQPYPEYSCKWMAREAEVYGSLGKVDLSAQDRELLKEAVEYWKDRCTLSKTRQVWSQHHGDGGRLREDMVRTGAGFDSVSHPLGGRTVVDYGKVLNRGLNGVIQDAEAALASLPLGSNALESQGKRDFLSAVVISCNAVVSFAQRYSALAQEMARKEADPERKKELEQIAETCQWVPANPARNFREAIQSFWFTHLATEIEACGDGHSPGRFSLYMYPFYQRDREEGRIIEEEALELVELLFIKFTEIAMHNPGRHFEEAMGSSFQNVSLGGITVDGRDATNDVDFLLIEAQRRVRTIQPTLSVLYHDKLSQEFVLKALELVRTGMGMPAFFNNALNVERLLAHGGSLEDARNHSIVGCVEAGYSHQCNTLAGGFINMPKLLELALNGGRDPQTGIQAGPKTPDPKTFQSYSDLHQAVKQQLEYFLPLLNEFQFTGEGIDAQFFPTPFISSLIDDCIKQGKDMGQGGSRYSMDGSVSVGTIDLADSLAAIKKLVFEEKSISMAELLQALAADFQGYEGIQQRLLDAPKYGNDDEYVDGIARDWYDLFYEVHQRGKDHLNRTIRPCALSITTHFPLGKQTGALPSGRKAGVPLADASVSPEPGKDRMGPTALIRSATNVLDTTKYAAGQLNMKFHPTALATKAGLLKMLSFVKTYMDLGGHHIQFNVVSGDTLRDAQLHPENYRDLIVRVAGFSAFFVHLAPAVQDEIIKRTEITF